MIKKGVLGILLLIIFCPVIKGQEKSTLTLKEAVIGAQGELKPTSLKQFTWLPDDNGYSFKEGEGDAERLVVKSASKRDHQEITLSLLISALAKIDYSALRNFPVVTWTSNTEFVFQHDHNLFQFDIESDEVKLLYPYDEKAENADLEKNKLNLAYTISNNLYVAFADGKVEQVTRHENDAVISGQAIHRYEFGIQKGTFWSPDGDKLAFYEKDDSAIPEFPIVDYTAEPVEVKGVRYPLAGNPSQIPAVGIFSTDSRKTIYLQTGPRKEHYLTNLTWSPDGSSIFLAQLDRDQRHMMLVKYDAGTGAPLDTLVEEKSDRYVEPLHGPRFIPGGRGEFLWFSERNGFNHLYRYSADGKLKGQVTRGNFEVADIVGFDPKGKNVWVTAYHPVLEKHCYKVDLRNGRFTAITEQQGVHNASLSADGRYLMVDWSGPEVPRKNDLYASDGQLIKNLHTSENPLENKVVGSTEIVTIPSGDGTDLYGRLIKPSHFDSTKKYPVLIYVYGGPHVQMVDRSWLNGAGMWMHYFAEQGYLIFTLDNRGSANRGREFEQAVFRQLGTLEVQDQLQGVYYLQQQPFVDPENFAVYGWSYGGFMAGSLMMRVPGIFKTGIAGGAVADWRNYEVMYTERYMDTPQQNPEGYERADLKSYAANLKGDLLLIHGTADDVVILDHTMDLIKKFIDMGVQVDYFNYPGYGHNVRGKDRLHLKQKIFNYLKDHVPPATND